MRASESRRDGEKGVGYVDREARAASEASIELASFPVAAALKPATLARHAQTFRRARDITGYTDSYRAFQKSPIFRETCAAKLWKVKNQTSLIGPPRDANASIIREVAG